MTIADPAAVPPLRRSESRPRLPKGDLRKPENNDAGEAIALAQQACGWNLEEFATAAQRDERQIKRWIDGTEHPQLDTLFAIVKFRKPLILALAKRAGLGVAVQTTITISEAA